MKYLHSWLQEYIEDVLPTNKDLIDKISINAFEVEEVITLTVNREFLDTLDSDKDLNTNQKDSINQKDNIDQNIDVNYDFVYEIKTLPNRNHDALSHYFMAKELATIFNLKIRTPEVLKPNFKILNKQNILNKQETVVNIITASDNSVIIKDSQACTRFMGCEIKNVIVGPSPKLIKYRLESIGQKSINNIVDITNYVQFSFNKPMHAYDRDLIIKDGVLKLEARFAQHGEVLHTLDNRELTLDDKTFVISDSKNVLGLAGIKGGKYSGISENTRDIFLESANFAPALIRKTSQKYNIRTDASKRFENEIADELCEIGMLETVRLIQKYCTERETNNNFTNIENTKSLQIGDIIDNWPNLNKAKNRPEVKVSLSEINNKIGLSLSQLEVENIFRRFNFDFKVENQEFVILPQIERLDLYIKEDLIEEVARVYGLNNIKSVLPELKNKDGNLKIGKPYKRLFFENKIKNILFKYEFSEVYNYSLRDRGDITLIKSVSQDKNKLRNNLYEGMQETAQKNIFNMPLLDKSEIRIFEFGNVFKLRDINYKNKNVLAPEDVIEERHLCILIDDGKKNKSYKEIINKIIEDIKTDLSQYITSTNIETLNIGTSDFESPNVESFIKVDIVEFKNNNNLFNCIEINFDKLISDLSSHEEYISLDQNIVSREIKYQNFSLMPFIVRDIAFWCETDTNKDDVYKLLIQNKGDLCVFVKLFDEFEKDFEIDGNIKRKKSLGYRFIYQDDNRTLSDEEVNVYTDKVYEILKTKGFEVR